MKKIWKLYIIFVVFFLLGDIGSTYIATSVKASDISSKVAIPEECICTFPPECDTSFITANTKSTLDWKIIIPKLIVVFLPLILIYSKIYIALVLLDMYLIHFTFANLAGVFYPYRFFIILIGAFINLFLLAHFLIIKEEEKK